MGIDTLSYENALKNALRETPDVIYIGEIRDQETMKASLNYAETGHLCLATLHANQAFSRRSIKNAGSSNDLGLAIRMGHNADFEEINTELIMG